MMEENTEEVTEKIDPILAAVDKEFKEGTMNVPYVADTLNSFAKHKIVRFMVEHYIRHQIKPEKMQILINKIKRYARDKNIDLRGCQFDPQSSGENGNIMVVQVKLEGTTYYKQIKQTHVDRYRLELQQIADNTKS